MIRLREGHRLLSVLTFIQRLSLPLRLLASNFVAKVHLEPNDFCVFLGHRHVHFLSELSHFLDLFVHATCRYSKHFDLSVLLRSRILRMYACLTITSTLWVLVAMIVCRRHWLWPLVEVALQKRENFGFNHWIVILVFMHNLRRNLLIWVMVCTALHILALHMAGNSGVKYWLEILGLLLLLPLEVFSEDLIRTELSRLLVRERNYLLDRHVIDLVGRQLTGDVHLFCSWRFAFWLIRLLYLLSFVHLVPGLSLR